MTRDPTRGTYVIDIGPQPSVAVAGSDARFPVGRIYCVGRNYADHAREMGHDPDREPPFFFMKPANSVVPSGASLAYPVGTKDVHHEIEMVVAIGKGGKNIPVEQALEHVWGYAVGLDMTRRDIQGEAKKMGRPWEMGKGFDESAPISRAAPGQRDRSPGQGRDHAQGQRRSSSKAVTWRCRSGACPSRLPTCRTWSRCSPAI